jgi:hypothetical protein
MPSPSDIIDIIRDGQDMELALALKDMQTNPSAYIAKKDALKNTILSAKDNAFNKIYSDALSSTHSNSNLLYYYRRNKELLDVNGDLANNVSKDAHNIQLNSHLASRQFELNEWAVHNKRDTLFIYQLGFIALSVSVLLTFFKKLNLITGGVYWYMIVAMIVIFIFTVLYRSIYSEMVRDKFYWNRRKFGVIHTPPAPSSDNCSSASV